MTGFLLILVLPLIIESIPFIILFIICNLTLIKNSTLLTIITSVVLTITSAWTAVMAMQLSIYGMSLNRPAGQIGCVTGVALFIFIGGILTILTFIFGVYFTFRNNQYSKIKNAETQPTLE